VNPLAELGGNSKPGFPYGLFECFAPHAKRSSHPAASLLRVPVYARAALPTWLRLGVIPAQWLPRAGFAAARSYCILDRG
jgi:hypothetical protein